jgi:Flp pilus assembly pilin Flp
LTQELIMKRLLSVWREEDGVLSFEWTLLLTLLTIGVVGGLAAARDAIIDELGDVAEAAQGIDQSYSLAAVSLEFDATNPGGDSVFVEVAADATFTDCARSTFIGGQGSITDVNGLEVANGS